ncbi:MAG: hypothetical protein GT598_11770 [Bacteroidales bacterium]|nr:hypothetical protein [Bacteroidales bacterium]OQB58953.1 MAG: hypothetical protein BWX96_02917 [Bacteroidetes bacterium ADurb.Bin145]
MKKTVVFTISLLILLPGLSGQEASLKPYGLKSGIIEYSYSGEKVGKGTLYFDDYGMKSAMYTDAVENGEKRKGWIVTFGDYQYMWDPDRSDEGFKLQNPIIAWLAESSKGDVESFTESIYSQMGFSKAPDETFLGKPCKVMKGNMGKVLTWNGILMLLDMKVMGTVSHQEATKIQANVPVDAKYFVIPKNIKFSEMPTMF